jgi:D-sedoheptulose 7-phosphate isomerase
MTRSTGWVGSFVQEYCAEVERAVASTLTGDVARAARRMVQVLTTERARIYSFGNGGSSAIGRAMQWLVVDSFRPAAHVRHCVASWSLDQIIEEAQAHGFGAGFTQILVGSRADGRDLVLCISVSGDSENLVRAAEYCLAQGIPVIALTGRGGGRLAALLGPAAICVDSADQQVAEDAIHAVLGVLVSEASRMLDCRPRRPGFIPQLVSATVGRAGGWIDQTSSSVARTVARGSTIFVVAPEGGATAVASEHVAHNLLWDMVRDLPYECDLRPPDVRAGPSVADFTGIANDRSMEEAVGASIQHVRRGDIALVFSDDGDAPLVSHVRTCADGQRLPVFGWLGRGGQRCPLECFAASGCRGVAQAYSVQMVGHLVMRSARAKLRRFVAGVVDVELEQQHARLPVSPRSGRPVTPVE